MTFTLSTNATAATPSKENSIKKVPSSDRVSDLDVVVSRINGLKRIPSYESLTKVMASFVKKPSDQSTSADTSSIRSDKDVIVIQSMADKITQVNHPDGKSSQDMTPATEATIVHPTVTAQVTGMDAVDKVATMAAPMTTSAEDVVKALLMDGFTEDVASQDDIAKTTDNQAQTKANAAYTMPISVKESDSYVADIPAEELEHLALLEVLPYLPPASDSTSVNIEIDRASTTALPSASTSSHGSSQITLHITISDDQVAQPPVPPNTRADSVNGDTSGHHPLPNPFPGVRRSSSIQSITVESNGRGSVTYRIVLVLFRIGAWIKRKILRRRYDPAASVAAATYARHQTAMQRRNHLVECGC